MADEQIHNTGAIIIACIKEWRPSILKIVNVELYILGQSAKMA